MSEKNEAKRDGAKLQKNSGRGQYQKSDAKLGDLSIDYKEYAKSYSITREGWGKVCTDAMKNGIDYEPVIKVILGEGNEKVRLAVVAWDYLEYLKDMEKENI
jgi:hypothetical protein